MGPPRSWVTDFALWDSVIVPTPPPFDPTTITGLAGWYDASVSSSVHHSSGVVSQWDDLSGDGHHLTVPGGAAGPTTNSRTRNGLNVIDAGNGSFDQMLFCNAFTAPSAYTMFVVCVQDTTAGGAGVAAVSMFLSASQTGIRIATTAAQMVSTSDSTFITGSAYTNGNWRRITGEHKGAGQTMSLWENGSLVGTATPAGAPAGNFNIFHTAAGGFQQLDGAIAEILVYVPNVSAPDRALIEAYLAGKWAVP